MDYRSSALTAEPQGRLRLKPVLGSTVAALLLLGTAAAPNVLAQTAPPAAPATPM